MGKTNKIEDKILDIGEEILCILFSDINDLIKEAIYGKPLYTLEIRPKITTSGLSKENIDYLYWVQEQGYKTGYFGSHVVTSKGLLIKRKDRGHNILGRKLENKATEYHLDMPGNSADILNLFESNKLPVTDGYGYLNIQDPPVKVERSHPSIFIDKRIYNIKKTILGFQLT